MAKDEHDAVGAESYLDAAKCVLERMGIPKQIAMAAVNWAASRTDAKQALAWAKEQAEERAEGGGGGDQTKVQGEVATGALSVAGERPGTRWLVDVRDGRILVGDTRCRLIAIRPGESIVGVPLGVGPDVMLRARRLVGAEVLDEGPVAVPTLLFGEVARAVDVVGYVDDVGDGKAGEDKETVAVLSSVMLEKKMGAFMRALADRGGGGIASGGGIAGGRAPRVVLRKASALQGIGPGWWSVSAVEGEGAPG